MADGVEGEGQGDGGAPQCARLRIEPCGAEVAVAPGQSLLEAAEAGGVALPASCRNGSCRTCLARVLEGRVSHRVPWPGLSPEERAESCWALPCVAVPESDSGAVVLLAPGAAVFY